MKIRSILSVSVIAGISLVQAAPIPTGSIVNGVYTVSSTDLLELSATVDFFQTSNPLGFEQEGEMGIPAFTNGVFGPAGASAENDGEAATAGNGAQVTYNFDLTTSPLGYNISQIDTYAGWSHGRYAQAYEILYKLVGSSTFVSLTSIDYSPDYLVVGDNSTKVSWVSNSGPFLLTGVSSLMFQFADTTTEFGTNFSGYRELDVFGQPVSVPEPSTTAALLGGVALLLCLKRFRRTTARG